MTDHPQLDLDVQMCFPLYAATRAVTRTYATLLADAGLTYPQYLVMLALWGEGAPMTVGSLGARLRLDSGTLTPLLKRLEAAGHLVRRRDAEDERRVLLDVTAQGWELREQVSDVPRQLVAAMGISLKEGKELREVLSRLIESLDAAAETDEPGLLPVRPRRV